MDNGTTKGKWLIIITSLEVNDHRIIEISVIYKTNPNFLRSLIRILRKIRTNVGFFKYLDNSLSSYFAKRFSTVSFMLISGAQISYEDSKAKDISKILFADVFWLFRGFEIEFPEKRTIEEFMIPFVMYFVNIFEGLLIYFAKQSVMFCFFFFGKIEGIYRKTSNRTCSEMF